MKYSEFFDRRLNTFTKSYELIKKDIETNIRNNNDNPYIIVELGSSRSFVNNSYLGCMSTSISYWNSTNPIQWDWGAGIFTKVFSDNLELDNFQTKYKLYTIDPDQDANFITKVMCKNNKQLIIKQTTSSYFLQNFDQKIDFIYMDHMESTPDQLETTALTHLYDVQTIVNKDLLNPNGIILIDDVGHNIINGKGKYSIPFLLENNYEILIHEYQVLLKRK